MKQPVLQSSLLSNQKVLSDIGEWKKKIKKDINMKIIIYQRKVRI